MSLLDALFGRKRQPGSKPDRMAAVTQAEITLQTELGMRSAGKAGLAIRSLAASQFDRVRADLEQMLRLAGEDLGSVTSIVPDEYGFVWAVIADEDFPDLVAGAQVASTTILEEGFGDQLLCAVFCFEDAAGLPLHLVYAFKRGTFYAFAPRSGQKRDLSLELRTHALLEGELPLEKDLEFRYPLWGTPLGG